MGSLDNALASLDGDDEVDLDSLSTGEFTLGTDGPATSFSDIGGGGGADLGWELDENSPRQFGPVASDTYTPAKDYDQLLVRIDNFRQDSGSIEEFGVRFNGDSDTNYDVNDASTTRTYYRLQQSKNKIERHVSFYVNTRTNAFNESWAEIRFGSLDSDSNVRYTNGTIDTINAVNVSGGEVAGTWRVWGYTR